MTRTLDEVIGSLPVEEQEQIKARAAELIDTEMKEATIVPVHEG